MSVETAQLYFINRAAKHDISISIILESHSVGCFQEEHVWHVIRARDRMLTVATKNILNQS